MTPQPRPIPDNSADAMLHMIGELALNKRLNGQDNAADDALGFLRGCISHLQVSYGHAYVNRVLQIELEASHDRFVRDAKMARGRP